MSASSNGPPHRLDSDTMNITKILSERLTVHIAGLGAKCAEPMLLPSLLREAEIEALRAGEAWIDDVKPKKLSRTFAQALIENQSDADASSGGKGGTPSSGGNRAATAL